MSLFVFEQLACLKFNYIDLGVNSHHMWLEGGSRSQGGEDQIAAGAGGARGGEGAGRGEVWGQAPSKSVLSWVALLPRFLILFEDKDVDTCQCGCNAEKKYVEHGICTDTDTD